MDNDTDITFDTNEKTSKIKSLAPKLVAGLVVIGGILAISAGVKKASVPTDTEK